MRLIFIGLILIINIININASNAYTINDTGHIVGDSLSIYRGTDNELYIYNKNINAINNNVDIGTYASGYIGFGYWLRTDDISGSFANIRLFHNGRGPLGKPTIDKIYYIDGNIYIIGQVIVGGIYRYNNTGYNNSYLDARITAGGLKPLYDRANPTGYTQLFGSTIHIVDQKVSQKDGVIGNYILYYNTEEEQYYLYSVRHDTNSTDIDNISSVNYKIFNGSLLGGDLQTRLLPGQFKPSSNRWLTIVPRDDEFIHSTIFIGLCDTDAIYTYDNNAHNTVTLRINIRYVGSSGAFGLYSSRYIMYAWQGHFYAPQDLTFGGNVPLCTPLWADINYIDVVDDVQYISRLWYIDPDTRHLMYITLDASISGDMITEGDLVIPPGEGGECVGYWYCSIVNFFSYIGEKIKDGFNNSVNRINNLWNLLKEFAKIGSTGIIATANADMFVIDALISSAEEIKAEDGILYKRWLYIKYSLYLGVILGGLVTLALFVRK